MSVAIVGSGAVGVALGSRLAAQGDFAVTMAARDPAATVTKLEAQGVTLKVASVAEAVAAAEVVILAMPGANDDAGIKAIAAGLPSVAGKVVIDATNPLSAFPALEVRWTGTSGGEVFAEALPEAAVFKAFNSLGVEHMVNPAGKDMFVAGDERPEYKAKAMAVVQAVGFKGRYVGPIRYARNLEAMAELWIHLAVPPSGSTKENWGRAWTYKVAEE